MLRLSRLPGLFLVCSVCPLLVKRLCLGFCILTHLYCVHLAYPMLVSLVLLESLLPPSFLSPPTCVGGRCALQGEEGRGSKALHTFFFVDV